MDEAAAAWPGAGEAAADDATVVSGNEWGMWSPTEASEPSQWNGLVFAVPKRRTSHSVKRMRMANKWLKPMKNITTCSQCGASRLAHNVCTKCVQKAMRRARRNRRESQGASDNHDDGPAQ